MATVASVEITNLREHPMVAGYRPHFRVTGERLGVEFLPCPGLPLLPGSTAVVAVQFSFEPQVCYDELTDSVEIEVLEGPHLIGNGRVLSRTLGET